MITWAGLRRHFRREESERETAPGVHVGIGLAVESFRATRVDIPNTRSSRKDFRQQIQQLGRLLRSPAGAALFAMMVGAREDPSLRRADRAVSSFKTRADGTRALTG